MSNNLQDTPLKFLRRNMNFARIGSIAKRGVNSLKEQGFEATWRKVDFRIKLMTKGDVWKFRSDLPLKRELARQKKAVFRVKTGIISSSEHRRHLRTFLYPQLATLIPL